MGLHTSVPVSSKYGHTGDIFPSILSHTGQFSQNPRFAVRQWSTNEHFNFSLPRRSFTVYTDPNINVEYPVVQYQQTAFLIAEIWACSSPEVKKNINFICNFEYRNLKQQLISCYLSSEHSTLYGGVSLIRAYNINFLTNKTYCAWLLLFHFQDISFRIVAICLNRNEWHFLSTCFLFKLLFADQIY